jgi:hypothetical protein
MDIGPSFTRVGDACTAGGLGEAEVAPADPNAHFDVIAGTGTGPSASTGATVVITTLGELIDVGR